MKRLANIASAQRTGRLRDLLFAGFVVLATTLAVVSVTTTAAAGQPSRITQR